MIKLDSPKDQLQIHLTAKDPTNNSTIKCAIPVKQSGITMASVINEDNPITSYFLTPTKIEVEYYEDENGNIINTLTGEINFNNMTVLGSSADIGDARVVKNLNFRYSGGIKFPSTTNSSKRSYHNGMYLRRFKGNINITGGAVTLFRSVPIIEAIGELNLTNITSLELLSGHSNSSVDGVKYSTDNYDTLDEFIADRKNIPAQSKVWFNTVDIRHVDTSNCTAINIMSHYKGDCTFILGNFSNESLSNGISNLNHPNKGRFVVMTTAIPPKLKNCYINDDGTYNGNAYETDVINGIRTSGYNNDWIRVYGIEKIFVPTEYIDTYKNNVFVTNGTVGKSGWSVWKDIMVTYNPETEYLEKKEGDDENGSTIWLYRK